MASQGTHQNDHGRESNSSKSLCVCSPNFTEFFELFWMLPVSVNAVFVYLRPTSVSFRFCRPNGTRNRARFACLPECPREVTLAQSRDADGGIIEDVMSPDFAVDRNEIAGFCQRHHITRLAVFGSVLRADFGTDSDVDVLVDFEAGHVPGLEFVSIERELSALLQGRRVDLVTPKFLNTRIRERVLREAEPLYVAA